MLSQGTIGMIHNNKMPVKVMVAKDNKQWRSWMNDEPHVAEYFREELEDQIENYNEFIHELESDERIIAMGPYFSNHLDDYRRIHRKEIAGLRPKLEAAEKLLKQMAGVPDDVWLHGESLRNGEIVVMTYTDQDGYTF